MIFETLVDVTVSLISAMLKLQAQIEALQTQNQKLSRTITQLTAMIHQLEGEKRGQKVEYPFIQSIELCADISEAKERLAVYRTQDGFFGGRIFEPGVISRQVRLQVFWTDDNPPSSWMTAFVRDEQLPDGMRHVSIPSFLQKTILLETERYQ